MPDGAIHPASHATECIDAAAESISSAEQDLARLLFTLAKGRDEGRDALSLARLAKRSGLPMSDLLRYLSVLGDAGWVDIEDGERGLRLARLTDAGLAQYGSLL